MYIFPPLTGAAARIGRVTVAMLLTCVLFGCVTVPPPVDSMDLAQSQLDSARQAGAADYAPVDLGFAQGKLQQAQVAMGNGRYADAADLAAESRADSELARAKAQLGAARAQVQQKVQENTRLRGQSMQADEAMPQPIPARSSFDPVPATDMPAAASSTPGIPAAVGFQPVAAQEMPAPASSTPVAPATGGFQTIPPDAQGAESTDEGQP